MARRGRKTDTQFDVAIVAKLESGLTVREIAQSLGLGRPKVARIVRRLGGAKSLRPSATAKSAAFEHSVTQLAAEGRSRREIGEILGIKPHIVANIVSRLKLTLIDTRGDWCRGTADQERIAAIAAAYSAGRTLQDIGNQYGISRERVRQILRKYTDVQASDGGASIIWARQREKRATAKDRKYMDRLGCGWDEYKRIRDLGREMCKSGRSYSQSPMGAFISQKRNANKRQIGWDLTFWQWWEIWQASGRWEQRGRGQGYVMCRKRDAGPYAADNVFIATAIENTASSKLKKSGLPVGVRAIGRRFSAQRMIGGKVRQLGTYATAQEAYAAYVAAAPSFRGVPSHQHDRRP